MHLEVCKVRGFDVLLGAHQLIGKSHSDSTIPGSTIKYMLFVKLLSNETESFWCAL